MTLCTLSVAKLYIYFTKHHNIVHFLSKRRNKITNDNILPHFRAPLGAAVCAAYATKMEILKDVRMELRN